MSNVCIMCMCRRTVLQYGRVLAHMLSPDILIKSIRYAKTRARMSCSHVGAPIGTDQYSCMDACMHSIA